MEYTGERVTHAEADARYDDTASARHHTFLLTIDAKTVIDAAVGGSSARYLNHSCEPNCRQVVEGDRVFIDAARGIKKGEELTYDYALGREGGADEEARARYACRCGARRCRGTLLSQRRARRA